MSFVHPASTLRESILPSDQKMLTSVASGKMGPETYSPPEYHGTRNTIRSWTKIPYKYPATLTLATSERKALRLGEPDKVEFSDLAPFLLVVDF